MNVELPHRVTWVAGATVLAPISWGTTYVTVTELLPDDRPLLVAAMRVVPSGVVLLIAGALTSRWRPRGAEWWRSGLLATFNFGLFFPLLIVAVYRLPGGVAAAFGGLQPLFVAALAWLISGRRPRALDLAVGSVAALGVGMVVVRPGAGFDPVGLLAGAGANVSFATGVVLTKRFPAPSNRVAATGWQLLLGGVLLVPLALIAEGPPPSLTERNVAGFAYLSVIGTALAFLLWFNGIRRLPAAAPPLLGLAAPITGAALGWMILDESLSPVQLTGFVVALAAIAYGASLRDSGPTIGQQPPPAAQPLRRDAAAVGRLQQAQRNGAGVPLRSLHRFRCPGVGDREVVAHRAVGTEDDEPVEPGKQPPVVGDGDDRAGELGEACLERLR
jgi:probable blue pigment (indigoidine) exporter